MLALRDQEIPLPSAVVAISPWTDLKSTGRSYRENARKCLAPIGSWTAYARHYAADNDPGLPLISPLYGELFNLPPMLIFAGEHEIHRDDAGMFAEKAAKAAMLEICSFIRMHLKCMKL